MNWFESVWHPFPELMRLPEDVVDAKVFGRDLTRAERLLLIDRFRPCASRRADADVVAMRCPTYDLVLIQQLLHEHLPSLGSLGDKLHTARRILIKPNLVDARAPEAHVTSSPVFLEALVLFLLADAPHAELVVAEGTGNERDSAYVLTETGIQEVLDQYGIAFVDLNLDDLCTVPIQNPQTMAQVVLPESICQADLVISFAKLKTHHWTGVTLGMKNLFGCLPGSVYGFPKNRLHWMSFPRAVADVAAAVKPGLTILDGIVAMEGNGPLDGKPRADGLIIAGTDCYATDILATQRMGFAPILIPQFWYPVLAGQQVPLAIDRTSHWAGLPVRPFAPPPNMPWLADSANRPFDDLVATLDDLLFISDADQMA